MKVVINFDTDKMTQYDIDCSMRHISNINSISVYDFHGDVTLYTDKEIDTKTINNSII